MLTYADAGIGDYPFIDLDNPLDYSRPPNVMEGGKLQVCVCVCVCVFWYMPQVCVWGVCVF